MKGQDFTCEITANVPAKDAQKCISRVSEWWAKDFAGQAEKLNDAFTVRFGETSVNFKLTEVVGGKKIVWHVTDCYLPWLKNKTEWNETDVIFEISETNGSSHIKFTHLGLVPAIDCYKDCVKGWTQHIKGSLLKLMTEGRGFPE